MAIHILRRVEFGMSGGAGSLSKFGCCWFPSCKGLLVVTGIGAPVSLPPRVRTSLFPGGSSPFPSMRFGSACDLLLAAAVSIMRNSIGLSCTATLPNRCMSFLNGVGVGGDHHSRAHPRGHGILLYCPSDGPLSSTEDWKCHCSKRSISSSLQRARA